MTEPIAVDFETEAIAPRPHYPPAPVGVAVAIPGERPRYWGWGHPDRNTCAFAEARELLDRVWRGGAPLVFHHAKFDLDVAETHLGLAPPAAFHCTMIEGFLHDPHETNLSLKPLSEKLLGLKPTERDELQEWIVKNVPEARRAKTKWGAYIDRAPGHLVGRYAVGDVVRTKKLHRHYQREAGAGDLARAYRRELALIPVLLKNERAGVRVDQARLAADVERWTADLDRVDAWLRRRLKAKSLDVDSNGQLADALEAAGAVTEWVMTKPSRAHPEGQRSTAWLALLDVIADQQLLHVLRYRSKLANALRNFGHPWLHVAAMTKGFIHTQWNQTKSDHGGGARTGRLSSSPNFQNIPKDPNEDGEIPLPVALAKQVQRLPYLRDYVLPDRGGVVLDRDYIQQELRILGHYEDGVLLRAYQQNPTIDFHEHARTLINEALGTHYGRKPVKILNFGILYGMGLGKLAKAIDREMAEARALRQALYNVFPGVKTLNLFLSTRAKRHEPIWTWGGRRYYVEPPRWIDGQLKTYDYKLLNVLIQGSAADCMKQALLNYDQVAKEGRLLLSVHDELVASAERGAARREMKRLMEAMEAVEFDLPMLSDGKVGPTWGKVKMVKDQRTEVRRAV